MTISRFCLVAALLTTSFLSAAERDIFDYAGQAKAGPDVKKIVFIGDAGTHGPPGNHEFVAGSILMARELHAAYPNVHAVVYSSKNWPKNLEHADAIIVGLNHGQKAATDPNIFAAVRKGAGFMAIHFGVEVNKGEAGNNFINWMGGYFETFWSVNPWWTPNFKTFPDHPICRGVKPFSVKDEWYYHMRFAEDMKGVTPILSDVPPRILPAKNRATAAAMRPFLKKFPPANRSTWRGRMIGPMVAGVLVSLGCTHANWGNDSFRTVLINGAAWVTKLEIPKDGVPSKPLDEEGLKKLVEEAKAAIEAGK